MDICDSTGDVLTKFLRLIIEKRLDGMSETEDLKEGVDILQDKERI